MPKEKKSAGHFKNEFVVLPDSTEDSCYRITRVPGRDQNLD